MQQIYWRTTMSNCVFNKAAKQQSSFIEIAPRHGCSPVNFLQFFRSTSGRLLLLLLLSKNVTNTGKTIEISLCAILRNLRSTDHEDFRILATSHNVFLTTCLMKSEKGYSKQFLTTFFAIMKQVETLDKLHHRFFLCFQQFAQTNMISVAWTWYARSMIPKQRTHKHEFLVTVLQILKNLILHITSRELPPLTQILICLNF